MILHVFSKRVGAALLALGIVFSGSALAQEALFDYVGPPDATNLPEHAVAGQNVRINRRAVQSPTISLDLFGETYLADRDSVDRSKPGQTVWMGHLQGDSGNTVILTLRGNSASGIIQLDSEFYRIGAGRGPGDNRLYMLDLRLLPPDDAGGLPDGSGPSEPSSSQDVSQDSNTVQDLLVVYNQAGCDAAANSSGSDCSQLEADIVTAVADINLAYSSSGIDITMNLVGTHKTVYTGTNASQTLSDLRGTTDGNMDEVHGVRDSLGADIVAMVYDGQGCGIGYLPASATSAFSVTDEPCLVGNRTMAHEIGHNQGAHHDRTTVGGGTTGAYNYGFRRCSGGGVDDQGSPYFRTILAYPCTSAPRVGRFSNPNVNYSGVPQGVDPDLDPANGAYNARTLNESASYVSGFRASAPTTPPGAPTGIAATAAGPDRIDVYWNDNSDNESEFELQRSPDNSSWSTIATLAANATSHADNGLDPETLYYYQVRARNSAGNSAWDGPASATTQALPPSIDDLAYGEVAGKGDVSGTYTATHAPSGAVQSITETHSGGPKHSRRQAYDHDWLFDVFGGAGGVIASVDAWVSGSEGATFYYSTDGGSTLHPMFTINNTSQGTPQTFMLPAGTAGQVRIVVQDASQANGEAVDTVYIDHLVITSHTEAGDPPATPSNMSVTGTTSSSVSVRFDDNSEDEIGFELWRATSDPAGNCAAGSIVDTLPASSGTGSVAHTDNSAAPSTNYWYWAVSFNGAGDNGSCSNAASDTTSAAPAISLSVSGLKVKGVKHVDLSWSGAGTANVDIWRNGSLLTTTANDGAYPDNTGQKGGGSYTYQVCEAGSTSSCSPEQTAVF
jgi:hypothetical protein